MNLALARAAPGRGSSSCRPACAARALRDPAPGRARFDRPQGSRARPARSASRRLKRRQACRGPPGRGGRRQVGLEQARQPTDRSSSRRMARDSRRGRAQRRDPAPDVVVDLDLEQQRHAPGDQLEQAPQASGSVPRRRRNRAEFAERRLADSQRARAHPPGVGIVKDDDPIVGGQPQVAFDPGAKLERRRRRRSGCFREIRRRSAARDAQSQAGSGLGPVERIRP